VVCRAHQDLTVNQDLAGLQAIKAVPDLWDNLAVKDLRELLAVQGLQDQQDLPDLKGHLEVLDLRVLQVHPVRKEHSRVLQGLQDQMDS